MQRRDGLGRFGGGPVGTRLRSGGRVIASCPIEDCDLCAIEARSWGLEDGAVTYFNQSDGSPILGRPFFNQVLQEEDAQLIAFPGVTTDGSVRIRARNDLIGADAALRALAWRDCSSQVYLLGGYLGYEVSEATGSWLIAFPVVFTLRHCRALKRRRARCNSSTTAAGSAYVV